MGFLVMWLIFDISIELNETGSQVSDTEPLVLWSFRMPSLRILLINTRIPRNTKDLVAGVRDKYTKVS